MATTKKTTTSTAKAPIKKTIANEVDNITDDVIKDLEVTTKPTKVERVYVTGDRIPCKSITVGKLIYYSTKTRERYEWSNYGDITDVLYEDLLSMKSSKSDFVYLPYFIIEDEELLSQQSWEKIREIYETTEVVDDSSDYLNQTPERLKQLLLQAPEGVKTAIKVTASQMIGNGELDSIRKIKVLDEVLGTQFTSFLG